MISSGLITVHIRPFLTQQTIRLDYISMESFILSKLCFLAIKEDSVVGLKAVMNVKKRRMRQGEQEEEGQISL